MRAGRGRTPPNLQDTKMADSFAISVILVLLLLQCVLSSPPYIHSVDVDKHESYRLSWGFDDKEIQFEVVTNATGYIGFGLSPDGTMVNADVVIGIIKNGHSSLKDYHGSDNGTLLEDPVQDWTLISANQQNNHTKLTFKRKLITNDKNDMDITGDTMRILWAYSDEEFSVEDFKVGGYKSLYLLQEKRPEIPIPDNATKLLIAVNQTVIPDDTTTYWCQRIQVPAYTEKMHVIKISPVITKGNEFFVHHMLLYECNTENPVPDDEKGHRCYGENMPDKWESCRNLIFGWAIGGSDFPLPEHVGLALEVTDKNRVFLLEIHYDNPERISGQLDSSGFEMVLIPARRDFDAGILEIGYGVILQKSLTMKIPPYQTTFRYQAVCNSNCIYDEYPNPNRNSAIKMFAVVLHGHLLAKQIIFTHFRNGRRISTIAADRNYDFNYQESVFLNKEIEFLPGDAFKVECIYSSTKKRQFTWGGFATTDEMCLVYVLYYPKMNAISCTSGITIHDSVWMKNNIENVVQFQKQEVAEEFEKSVNGIGRNSSFLTFCSDGNSLITHKHNSEDISILRFRIPETTEQPITTTEESKAGIGVLNMFGFSLKSLLLAGVLLYLVIP